MKKIIFLIFILLGLTSCNKKEFNIENLNDNKITILGHGGMGISHIYPMNSYESISRCLNLNADGTEIDVQMTIDSVLIAYHDYNLEKKTNAEGNVFYKKWDEICNTTYKKTFFGNYNLINLDYLFSNLDNKNEKIFMLDCKNFKPDTTALYRETFCRSLLKIIDKFNLQNNVIIELKREDIIKTLKKMRPELKIFIYSDFEYGLEMAQKYKLQGIVISIDKISKEEILTAHKNGLQVAVFNTHSHKRNIDAIEKNVDIIQTDRLRHLLRLLK